MVVIINIRRAVPCDHARLEALQTRASLANPGDRDALLACKYVIELPRAQIETGQVFVAEIDGNTVGFAVLLPRDGGDDEIDGLFVEPGLWRRGVGRRLVSHCITVAREHGSRDVYVMGNRHAEGFYRSCGFELLEVRPLEFGEALWMRKAVDGSSPAS